jgi:hypothetical protein
MESAQQALERAFLSLPELKHVGMALLQFAISLFGNPQIVRTETGGFSIRHLGRGFLDFSVPEGREGIRMHVNVETEKLEGQDKRWLPISDGYPYPFCEIKRQNQLAVAARYIEAAYWKCMGTRFTSSDDFDRAGN